jgi:hypothetical protein
MYALTNIIMQMPSRHFSFVLQFIYFLFQRILQLIAFPKKKNLKSFEDCEKLVPSFTTYWGIIKNI